MWQLIAQLTPEMLGLAVTPAAIIGCMLLLGSRHPVRNVSLFGATFLVIYAALATVVVTIGNSAGRLPVGVRGWLSLTVGVLFLAGGAFTSWRRARTEREPAVSITMVSAEADSAPGLARSAAVYDARISGTSASKPVAPEPAVGDGSLFGRLSEPSVPFVLATGALLALINPNLAILASGVGMILTVSLPVGQQIVALCFLIMASMLDFIVPSAVCLVGGSRVRGGLREATGWLVAHNQAISLVVLFGFGMLFAGRGWAQLVG